MPDEQPRRPSGEEMRRFILNQLGEAAGGLTQEELLTRFTHWYIEYYNDRFDKHLDWQFLSELKDMREGGRIMMGTRDDCLVHQQTPHGWLAWAGARQEQDATQAAARL